jgi:hypothetical protein
MRYLFPILTLVEEMPHKFTLDHGCRDNIGNVLRFYMKVADPLGEDDYDRPSLTKTVTPRTPEFYLFP